VRHLAQPRDQLVSVYAWEANVGDDYIKPPRLGNAERLLGRRADRRGVAARFEGDLQHLQSVRCILDEQDVARPLRTGLARARLQVAGVAPRAVRLDGRQCDREAAAASLPRALGTDAAAVRLDEALDEREPQPQASVRARRRHVRLPEALEDVRQELRLDAGALVLDLDACRAVGRADADADTSPLARELDGVV